MTSTALTLTNNSALATMRSKKRKVSDSTIQKHVGILEQLAFANGGFLPPYKWLDHHGYFTSYDYMCQYPAAFEHIKRETDKKFEIYQAHNSAVPEILPPEKKSILAPANYKSIADYDIHGARFSPIELRISEGVSETEWMEIGRGLTHVAMACFWWVGDWIAYGKTHYGVKISYDLAQQATAFSRSVLYSCVCVAKRFPAERRVEALTFYHHSVLCKFLPELADKLLQEAVEYGYTARQIRAMADEATGKKKKPGHRISFVLSDDLYDELQERATGELKWFVPQFVIREWLAATRADWLKRNRKEENV